MNTYTTLNHFYASWIGIFVLKIFHRSALMWKMCCLKNEPHRATACTKRTCVYFFRSSHRTIQLIRQFGYFLEHVSTQDTICVCLRDKWTAKKRIISCYWHCYWIWTRKRIGLPFYWKSLHCHGIVDTCAMCMMITLVDDEIVFRGTANTMGNTNNKGNLKKKHTTRTRTRLTAKSKMECKQHRWRETLRYFVYEHALFGDRRAFDNERCRSSTLPSRFYLSRVHNLLLSIIWSCSCPFALFLCNLDRQKTGIGRESTHAKSVHHSGSYRAKRGDHWKRCWNENNSVFTHRKWDAAGQCAGIYSLCIVLAWDRNNDNRLKSQNPHTTKRDADELFQG